MMAAGGIFTPASATTSGREGMRRRPNVPEAEFGAGGYGGAMAAAGKPTIKHTPSSWFDDGFMDKLKEQLEGAGENFDKADQPFKSLTPVSIPGARHQPVANPSMLNTRGIPTGGSYNPYLGAPAKRKRVR